MNQEELEAQCAAMRATFEHILEYWNKDENEDAMKDALWHIIDVASESLSSNAGGELLEYRQWYEEAMIASNEAGFVGMDAASVIRYQDSVINTFSDREELTRLREAEITLSLLTKEYVGDAAAPATDLVEFIETARERLRKAEEQVRVLAQQLDAPNGSPCEQVRHQQEIDQLSERLRKAEEYQDKADSVFRELCYWLGVGGYNSDGLMPPDTADDKLRFAINAFSEREESLRAELERCKKDNTHSALREMYQRTNDELDISRRDYEVMYELCKSAEDERDRLRSVCAEAYQMAGALNAPIKALDNLRAASRGEPLPHDTFLPVLVDVEEGGNE